MKRPVWRNFYLTNDLNFVAWQLIRQVSHYTYCELKLLRQVFENSDYESIESRDNETKVGFDRLFFSSLALLNAHEKIVLGLLGSVEVTTK